MELVLGIVGTVLGVISLLWQTHTWRQSGARVAVDGVLFSEKDSAPVLKVEIRNEGRGTCELRSMYLFSVNGRDGFDPTQYRLGDTPTLPATLGPGQCVVLQYRASAIARALAHHGGAEWSARVHVRLGDGSDVRSKGSLMLTESLGSEDEFTVEHGDGIAQTRVYGSTVVGRDRAKRRKIFRLLDL